MCERVCVCVRERERERQRERETERERDRAREREEREGGRPDARVRLAAVHLPPIYTGLRTTTSQNFEAVPRRARIQGS